MKRPPSNIAHSVRTCLLTVSKAEGEEYNYVLVRYALERFLERLSRSPHRDSFILKGAMLFRLWAPRTHRPTKDLDLLGRGSPDLARLAALFAEVCTVAVEDDGVVLDAKIVKAARIKEDAEYEGVRVTFGDLKLGEIVEAMTRKLAPFETWKERLVQDDAILGGEPVFPRSRLAVRKIGSMLIKGASVDEVKEDYPFLDGDDIEIAKLFAAGYPVGCPPGR